jgi:precorrin-6A/cobalt-precorrin-6A reductase
MGRSQRLLLLGGTTEASALARALAGRPDLTVVTSLAGRTSRPTVLPGEQRVGGFGGAGGLADYLIAEGVDLVVDATHPFAAVMGWHADEACRTAGVARLRVERPPWTPQGGDRWTRAGSLAEAGKIVAGTGAGRVLITTGRGDLGAFLPAVDGRRWWLVRCIEPPDPQPLQPGDVVLDRGPYDLPGERRLFEDHGIDLLVTKNSGGRATAPKLEAARSLGVEVVMVDRPPSPPGRVVATVAEAVAWVDTQP